MLKSEVDRLKQTNYKLLEQIEAFRHEENPENIETLFIQNKLLRSLTNDLFNWLDALSLESSQSHDLQAKCHNFETEVNRLKDYITEQTKDLKHPIIPGDHDTETQLEALRRKVIELESEKENLNRDLDFWKEKFEKDSQLRFKLQALEDQVKILETERDSPKESSRNLSTQFSDNITLNPDVFERLNELERLKKENSELQEKVRNYDEGMKQVEHSSEERAALMRQLEEENEEQEELRDKLGQMREVSGEKMESLVAELESIRELLQENEIIKLLPEENTTGDKIWIDVRDQKEGGMKEASDVRKKVIELIAVNKRLAGLVQENQQVAPQTPENSQIKLRDDRIAELEKDRQRLYIENDQLKRKVVDSKAHEGQSIEELQAKILSLSEEVIQLVNQANEKDMELKRLQSQLEEAQAPIKAGMTELKQEISRLQMQNEQIKNLLGEKDRELSELKQKLAASSADLRAKIDEILKERTSLMEERDVLAGTVYENNVELEHMKSLLKKAEVIYKENVRLEDLLNKRSRETEELSTKIKELEARLAERVEELRVMTEERSVLSQKVESISQANEGARLDLAQLQSERDQLKRKFEHRDVEFHEICEKLEHLHKEHSRLSKEHEGIVPEFEELKMLIEHVNIEKEDLIKVLIEKDGRIEAMGNEVAKLGNSLTKKLDEYKILHSQLDKLTFENAELQEKLESYNKRINELNLELQDQKVKEASFAQTFKNEVSELADRIESLNQDRTRLIKENESLVQKLQSKDSQISEVEQRNKTEFETKMRELQDLLIAKEQVIQEWKDYDIELEGLRNEFTENRSLVDKISSQRDELLKELEERNSQLTALNKEIETFWSNIQAQNIEIAELKRQKEELEANLEVLKEEVSQREQMIENLTRQLNEINAGITSSVQKLTEEKEEIIAQMKNLNIEKELLQEQRDSLQNIVNEKDRRVADLMKAVKSLEENITARNKELIQEREERIAMLTEELNQSMVQLEARKAEFVPLMSQIEALKVEIEELKTKNEGLTEVVATKDHEMTKLNGHLSKLEFEISTKIADNDILREDLNKLSAENAKLKEIMDSSSQYLDTLNQKLEPTFAAAQEEPTLEAVREELNNMVQEQDNLMDPTHSQPAAEDTLSLEESLAKLKFELANRNTDCEILKEQLHKLAAENAKLREVVENASKRIDNLEEQQESNEMINQPVLKEKEVLVGQGQEEPAVENLDQATGHVPALKANFVQLEKDIATFASGVNENGEKMLFLGTKMERLQKHFIAQGRESQEFGLCVSEFHSLTKAVESLQSDLAEFVQQKEVLLEKLSGESNVSAMMEQFIVLDDTLQTKSDDNKQVARILEKLSATIDKLERETDIEKNAAISNHKAIQTETSEPTRHVESLTFKEEFDKTVIERDELLEILGHKVHEILTLENELSVAKEENSRLTINITELQQELERTVDVMKKSDVEINGIKGLLEYSAAEVQALKERVTNLEIENEKLRLELGDEEKELQVLKEPLQELGSLEDKIKEAELARSKAKEHPETLDRLREALFNLQQDLLRVINDRDSLHKVLKTKESELEQLKPIIPFYETLIACLRSADQEIARLNSLILQRDSYLNEVGPLTQNVENLSRSYEQAMSNNEKLVAENSVLRGQVQEFLQIIADLENRYRQLEKTLVDVTTSSKVVKQEHDDELTIPCHHGDHEKKTDKNVSY